MDRQLFNVADFLSRPPGFYLVMMALVACTILVPLGWTEVVTYVLSVAAIVITGVVLIQGYRDTAAIHAKLDEIVVALNGNAKRRGRVWNTKIRTISSSTSSGIEREALMASDTQPTKRHRHSIKGEKATKSLSRTAGLQPQAVRGNSPRNRPDCGGCFLRVVTITGWCDERIRFCCGVDRIIAASVGCGSASGLLAV